MDEKKMLASLNGITYSEEELEKYVGNKEEFSDTELHMRKHFIVRAVSKKEAYNYISPKLRLTEEVLHIMGTENMHARMAQSGVAILSGIGALPFLQMQINAILIITNERLFVAMLDGDFNTAELKEYALEEIDSIKTAMDGSAEYLFITLKKKKKAAFHLFSPGYNFEAMQQKLEGALNKRGVKMVVKDKKMEKNIKNVWILVWGFIALVIAWFIYIALTCM